LRSFQNYLQSFSVVSFIVLFLIFEFTTNIRTLELTHVLGTVSSISPSLYASWQKGAIENTNKLIRQYIPKQANFDDFTDKKIASIQKKNNS